MSERIVRFVPHTNETGLWAAHCHSCGKRIDTGSHLIACINEDRRLIGFVVDDYPTKCHKCGTVTPLLYRTYSEADAIVFAKTLTAGLPYLVPIIGTEFCRDGEIVLRESIVKKQ